MIDRAVAAFDTAAIAYGDSLLRAALASAADTARPLRARALLYRAAAKWWLGEPDSTPALFAQAVEADPFVEPDHERFNPDLAAALRAARRRIVVLGLHVVADTTLRPDSSSWPIALAVGRPGDVRLRLNGEGIDSAIGAAPIDSTATIGVRLVNAAGGALVPGSYRLVIDLAEADRRLTSRELTLTVERLAVDTTAFVPEPLRCLPVGSCQSPMEYRVETRRGGMSTGSLLRGLLLGGAALVVPMAIATGDVPKTTVTRGAAAMGIGLAAASLIGAATGRPTLSIEENVRFNRQLRESWIARNRAIAVANDYRRRYAPLRIRATIAP